MPAPPTRAEDATMPARWTRALAFAGLLAALAGIVATGLWRVLPAERTALSLALLALAWALAWPLRAWLRWSWAAALACAWWLALVAYVGPVPVFCIALLAAAALAIGLGLCPAALAARPALAFATGLMLLAGVAGWTVTWPLHAWWLWWPLLLGVVAWRRRALAQSLAALCIDARDAIEAAPRLAAWCVALLGLASTACWLPAIQSDDLSYHLGLPMQWLAQARYVPDPAHQVWAYAPWAGDVLQGIGCVLARRDAHGALNALWLCIATGAAWAAAAAAGATVRERWLAVLLYACFPPLLWMAAGLQTELAACAVLFAFAAVAMSRAPGRLAMATVLLAGLFALKPVHGLCALPLLAFAAWRAPRPWPWRALVVAVVAVVAFCALAGSSYVQSWLATGNPLLPALNPVFHSSYYPDRPFVDARWHAGTGPALPWWLTFATGRYFEGWNGGLGFGLVALGGLWLAQLLRPGRRAAVVVATLVAFGPLLPMQYARYAWPGIALLLLLLPAGGERLVGRGALRWLVVATCALNLAWQANASWLHHASVFKRTLLTGGNAAAVWTRYAPDRLLVERIPAGDDRAVLATDPERSLGGVLAGRGRSTGGHDPRLSAAAAAAGRDATGATWDALLAHENIGWVVARDPAAPALQAGLQRARARRVDALHGMALWRLPDDAPREVAR